MNFLTDQEKEKLAIRNKIANHFTHQSHRELSLTELQTIYNIIYAEPRDCQHKVVE